MPQQLLLLCRLRGCGALEAISVDSNKVKQGKEKSKEDITTKLFQSLHLHFRVNSDPDNGMKWSANCTDICDLPASQHQVILLTCPYLIY